MQSLSVEMVDDVVLQGRSSGLPLADDVDVLVFLSGWPDTHDMWKHQVASFGSSHHCLTITTPDFDEPGLRRRRGYTPVECAAMIQACIDRALGPQRAFTFVIHDWGAVWGYMIAEKLAPTGRIRKIVALDVGASPPESDNPRPAGPLTPRCNMLWILIYQCWYAFCFWVGFRISGCLANGLLGFFNRFLFKPLGPLGCCFSWDLLPRPWADVHWWMCYPYFHFIRGPVAIKLPAGIPTLFIYGENKRAFFHSGDFVSYLEVTAGCKAIGYKCSHWLMCEMPDQLNSDMREFL